MLLQLVYSGRTSSKSKFTISGICKHACMLHAKIVKHLMLHALLHALLHDVIISSCSSIVMVAVSYIFISIRVFIGIINVAASG